MADILIEELTTGEHEGRGVFDELMRTAKSHLIKEFEAGRISSDEYSKVYLGALQASMQAGMQFVLGSGVAARQEELLANQGLGVIAETLVTNQQLVNLTNQNTLITEQIAQVTAENLNLTQQLALLTSQTAMENANKLIADKQLDVMDNDMVNKTSDTDLNTQREANLLTQNAVIVKQGTKMDQETSLLLQKTRTEEAQILDTVNGNPVTGVIGTQKTLYAKQTDGFDRDAEQKAMKFMSDNWGLRLNSDPLTVLPGSFSNTEIDKVLAKVKLGIGVT